MTDSLTTRVGAHLPQVDHEGRGVDRRTLARLHPRVDGVGAPDGRCLVKVRARVRVRVRVRVRARVKAIVRVRLRLRVSPRVAASAGTKEPTCAR